MMETQLLGRNDDWRLPSGGGDTWIQFTIQVSRRIQRSRLWGFPPSVIVGKEVGEEGLCLFIHQDETGGCSGSAFARYGMARWFKYPLDTLLEVKGEGEGAYIKGKANVLGDGSSRTMTALEFAKEVERFQPQRA